MHNPVFDFFGGRKNFNAYVGILLVGLWTWQKWPQELLWVSLGFLGLQSGLIALEDQGKKK